MCLKKIKWIFFLHDQWSYALWPTLPLEMWQIATFQNSNLRNKVPLNTNSNGIDVRIRFLWNKQYEWRDLSKNFSTIMKSSQIFFIHSPNNKCHNRNSKSNFHNKTQCTINKQFWNDINFGVYIHHWIDTVVCVLFFCAMMYK